MAWKDGKATLQTPWSKLDDLAMALVQKILVSLPSGRSTIKEIQSHGWCNKCFDILGKHPRKYIRPGGVGFIKFATV
jgi:hypothetical protein